MSTSKRVQLEAAIDADPGDREAYAVLADHQIELGGDAVLGGGDGDPEDHDDDVDD